MSPSMKNVACHPSVVEHVEELGRRLGIGAVVERERDVTGPTDDRRASGVNRTARGDTPASAGAAWTTATG